MKKYNNVTRLPAWTIGKSIEVSSLSYAVIASVCALRTALGAGSDNTVSEEASHPQRSASTFPPSLQVLLTAPQRRSTPRYCTTST